VYTSGVGTISHPFGFRRIDMNELYKLSEVCLYCNTNDTVTCEEDDVYYHRVYCNDCGKGKTGIFLGTHQRMEQ
jgi:hypothetical protein